MVRQRNDPPPAGPPPLPCTQTNKPSTKHLLSSYISIIPEPIPPYQVPNDILQKNFLERSLLCLEYTVLTLEYRLSPKGHLRAWLKFWTLLFLYICIPIVLLTPIVSYLIHEFTSISQYLLNTSQDLFYALLYASGSIVILIVLLALFRQLLRSFFNLLFK